MLSSDHATIHRLFPHRLPELTSPKETEPPSKVSEMTEHIHILLFLHAAETTLNVFCSPSPHSNIASCILHHTITLSHCLVGFKFFSIHLQCAVIRGSGVCCFSGALCHEKPLLLPRLAEAETFRHTGGGRRGLHQIQQCRLCAESECQSSLPEKTKKLLQRKKIS